MVCFVVTQHSERALSLCIRYSKTSCRRQLKTSTDHTEDTEKDFRRMIKTTPSDFKPQTSDFIFALQALQYNNITVSKTHFCVTVTVLQFLKRKNRCV